MVGYFNARDWVSRLAMGLLVFKKAPAGVGAKKDKITASIDLMFVDQVAKYIVMMSSIPYTGLIGNN